MKKLALLGSTGSIGTQALDVVRCIQKEGDGAVEVTALAAHSNIRLLEAQIREFKPQAVAVFDLQAAEQLRAAVRDCDVRVYAITAMILAPIAYLIGRPIPKVIIGVMIIPKCEWGC